MEIFNFELEEKIDHHSSVEFHGESSGDNLNVQKLNYNTLIALIGPNYKIWKFRLVSSSIHERCAVQVELRSGGANTAL